MHSTTKVIKKHPCVADRQTPRYTLNTAYSPRPTPPLSTQVYASQSRAAQPKSRRAPPGDRQAGGGAGGPGHSFQKQSARPNAVCCERPFEQERAARGARPPASVGHFQSYTFRLLLADCRFQDLLSQRIRSTMHSFPFLILYLCEDVVMTHMLCIGIIMEQH